MPAEHVDDAVRGNGEPAVSPSFGAPDRRYERLAALAQVEFAGESSAGEVLAHVARLTTELLPTSIGASVIVWHPDEQQFVVAASTVPGQEAGHYDGRIRAEGGATRWIFDSQQRAVVPDVRADRFGPGDLSDEFGVRAYVGVPIESEGRALGILYALDGEPREYTEDDLEFLDLLARRAAAAVLHARLFSDMSSARERSEALAWAANAVIAAEDLEEVLFSVVEGTAAAANADRAELVTLDSTKELVVDYAASGIGREAPSYQDVMEGPTGWVMRERRLTLLPGDDDDGPAIVAPLRNSERILGTLTVCRAPGAPRFTDAEVDLVLAMANQTAVAIDNVRLLETTRRSLAETQAMYATSQALIDSADVEQMLRAVAQGVAEAVVAESAIVATVDLDNKKVLAQATVGTAGPADFKTLWTGPTGEVLRSGTARRERSEGLHWLVAPLKVHDRLLGVLSVVRDGEEEPFTDRQYDTLLTLAAQSAVAIENHLLFEQVQRLAITDDLTGIHSRRHLFQLGEQEFAQAIRYHKPLAAMMFDLDHFKTINDTLGHVVGDEVLRGVADRCRRVLREVDILGRFGGEEFAVILPEIGIGQAAQAAERLREAVGADPIETGRGPVVVTISVGVAEVKPGVLDLKTLLDRADSAMYAAKRAGRNRVELANGAPGTP